MLVGTDTDRQDVDSRSCLQLCVAAHICWLRAHDNDNDNDNDDDSDGGDDDDDDDDDDNNDDDDTDDDDDGYYATLADGYFYATHSGAPLGNAGGNNYPLRGGKSSSFEGGVRANAFLSGGWIPEVRQGAAVNESMNEGMNA